jgi:hypothetical protein
VAARFQMTWRIAYGRAPKRMAIFVSKYDHCLYDLLLRHRAGELACEIPLILSNHPDLKRVADQFDVAFEVFPITRDNKREQEDREMRRIEELRSSCWCCALHAGAVGRVRGAPCGAHHQHPPLVPAGVHGQQAVSPGAQPRREADRRDGALRHDRPRRRPDHRPGRRALFAPRFDRGPGAQGPRPREGRARARGAPAPRRPHPRLRQQDGRIRLDARFRSAGLCVALAV